jgi:hypothetical protein
MSNFFDKQGRTRVYVAGENPRRTPLIGKRAISGWKQVILHKIKPAAQFAQWGFLYSQFM